MTAADAASADPATLLRCPSCRSGLRLAEFPERLDERCPVCGSKVEMLLFPRLRSSPPPPYAPPAVEGGTVCSFFPELKATKVCDECGCLLSEAASVTWGDGDYCLPCLHRLREEKREGDFIARASLHDNRALALVTLLAPFTLFTAPLALFILLRYRKQRASFAPRGRARWWLALVLSLAWIALWTALLVTLAWLFIDSIS